MGKRNKQAIALTSEQITTMLALLAEAGVQIPAPAKPVAKRKAKVLTGDVLASADGFTFAWTREKVKSNGVMQYRLVIARGSKILTRDAGYPYAVREENGTLADKVALGVPVFAMSLAKSLAK